MISLVSKLGLDPAARVLLITADDLGLSHASNVAVDSLLRDGSATSAGLLVPAPWARDAALRSGSLDVGVHLTLTAELPNHRWGPVTFAPSLLGGDGGFPATVEDLHDHADPDEVRRECRAQLERAVLYGVDPTHLSVHQDALFAAPALFDVVAELAEEAGLPLRLPDPGAEPGFGFPLHALASERGIVHPDCVRSSRDIATAGPSAFIASLRTGVTELVVNPADDTPELRALAPDADERVADRLLLDRRGELASAIAGAGVTLIGWRALRAVARG
jgi:hypothetical protein